MFYYKKKNHVLWENQYENNTNISKVYADRENLYQENLTIINAKAIE